MTLREEIRLCDRGERREPVGERATLDPPSAARLDVDRDELARGAAEARCRREHQLVALVSADRDPAGVPQQPLGRRPDHHHDTEHILSVAIAAKMPVSLTWPRLRRILEEQIDSGRATEASA
mgnify:CR=1 FL=1